MRHEIIMPALGMAQDTGTLLAWHKSEGDAVTQGEALFEVETDKTTMEVEAPASGFLVGVSASDGDEVPVGKVIALISDSLESADEKNEPTEVSADESPDTDQLPPGKPIIMPVLGMSQDTGILVRWSKELGDAVKKDDILFEVETDKSVVEVEAGADGYLAARLATAGDDIPTGETIAIISEAQVANRVDRAYSVSALPVVSPAPVEEAPDSAPALVEPAKPMQGLVAPKGKILASPKLKRMAHQAGYNLALLAETKLPQPYHARDFEALRQANEAKRTLPGAPQSSAAISRLTARISSVELDSFLTWATDKFENHSDNRAIATFAGASISKDAVVRVDKSGESVTYSTHQQISNSIESKDEPDLIVHDLRGTLISSAELPPTEVPVISIVGLNDELTLTLTCNDALLAGKDAAVLLDNFAGRLADPIRHLF